MHGARDQTRRSRSGSRGGDLGEVERERDGDCQVRGKTVDGGRNERNVQTTRGRGASCFGSILSPSPHLFFCPHTNYYFLYSM